MSAVPALHTRRALLAASAAAGAVSLVSGHLAATASDKPSGQIPDQGETPKGTSGDNTIRPFRIEVPEAALVDLRRRIASTRWPDRETVADESQGVQLATIQELASYWGTDYDWRKVEARLNALPQFITEIDGLDIHFVHVRSNHENALPLIVTHGWQLKKHGIHQLIVIGLIAHTCVEATVRYAAELGYDVTVVGDATADYSDEMMHAALDINIPNYASAILSTEEIVASISALADSRASATTSVGV